jgi:hypothetical protein
MNKIAENKVQVFIHAIKVLHAEFLVLLVA